MDALFASGNDRSEHQDDCRLVTPVLTFVALGLLVKRSSGPKRWSGDPAKPFQVI